MCRRKQRDTVFCFGIINSVKNRRIGREYNSSISVVLIAAQITQRHIRKIVFEIVLCLFNKSCSVGEEQDICYIIAPAQNVCQTGSCSRLSCTRCHHQKSLTETLLDMLTYSTDSFLLIIAVGYFIIYGNGIQLFACITTVHQLFKVGFCEKAADLALR